MLERLKARLLARLPSRRQAPVIGLVDEGLVVSEGGRSEIVAWAQIDEVVAARVDQWVGDTMQLVIRFAGQRTLTIAETSDIWAALIECLPQRLPGARQHPQWTLELLAQPDLPFLRIYSKASG